MDFIERGLAKLLKVGMTDYCDIETIDDDKTLIHRDGSLTTFLELKGSLKASGPKREQEIVETLTDRLSGIMKSPGFRIQFMVTRDPDANERALKEALMPAVNTAKRIKLNVGPLLSERARVLNDKVAIEHACIAITTQLGVFQGPRLKEALAERLATVRAMGVSMKPGLYGQSPLTVVEALRETHQGFITSFRHSLSEFLSTSIMPAREALRMLAFSMNPSVFHRDWQPILPGDRVPVRLVRESKQTADVSHLQYPDLGFQLFPQAPSDALDDGTMVKLGDRYIAPILVDIPPQKPQPFDQIFQAIPRDVPFRFMITIETGHDNIVSKVGNKKTIATFLAMTSSQSRAVKAAAEEILSLVEDGGHRLVSATISFCTWGPDHKTTSARKAVLMQSAQAWGSLQVIEERGDAVGAWLGTLPAISRRPSGNSAPWFLEEALSVLPLSRPASPWSEGSMMFRTLDTKPYPYQSGSSKQTAWVDLVFAPPGYGKSLFLAAQNLGLILSPGRDQLPRLATLDIGYSSTAFVEFLRQALPAEMRYQAQAFKLTLSKDNAINPFDTPLGSRHPLTIDKTFLSNFLNLLLTPAGVESVPRLPELIGLLIDAMYDRVSDDGEPNTYERGYCQEVDAAIEKHALYFDEGATWWNVVDALFEAGDYHMAGIAQTFAVPQLADATSVLSSDLQLRDSFGNAKVNDEPLIDFLKGMIVSAIKEFPLLSSPTVFDTGGARVVAIDLQDVAKSGGSQANKRTAVMYMLARQAVCREFYRNDDNLPEMHPNYREYHAALIERERGSPKKLCMDEYHRTSKASAVREQSLVDIREGRKFDVHITLLSQLLGDFPSEMVEMANNIWILSRGKESTTKEIEDLFKPSPDAVRALRRYVTGPGPEGSSFLYLGDIKGGGRIEQVLRLTLGPREIWAYSTTAKDVALRGAIAKRVGLPKALALLADRFPGGSAQEYLEQRGLKSESDDEAGGELIQVIAREIIAEGKTVA